MRRKLLLNLVAGSICLAGIFPSLSLAKPAPATAEAFAASPNISRVAISADGNRIAFGYTTATGETQVRVLDVPSKKTVGVTVGDKKLRSVRFEDGGDVLITASDTFRGFGPKAEVFRTFSFNFETANIRTLLATGGMVREYNSGVNLHSLLPDTPNRVIMSAYDVNNSNMISLNLYEVATNGVQVVTKALGNSNTIDWITDRAGTPLARVDHDADRKTTKLFLLGENNQSSEALRLDDTPAGGINLMGLSRQGRIIFSKPFESEFGELFSIDPKTGAIATFLRADGTELESVFRDPWSDVVVGVSIGGFEPMDQMISQDLQAAQATLEATFEGKIISIVSFSRDRKKIIARIQTPSTPPEYLLLEVDGPKVMRLGEAYPGLKNVPMGRLKATTFKARDGAEIPVYVTLPPGDQDIKNAPTIIFPHGGPEARDEPRFDYWTQFMATRGYVVIQPQFRGSTGFGKAHADAGRRQWGKRMQDDVSDAVAWAVKEGLSDPKKVCIVGGSYGGYAALAGATMTPDLYRCVVAVAGVSDLPRMIAQEKDDAGSSKSSSVNYWSEHIGADDRAAMEAASPRRLADQVRAPILLMHGRDDTVVRFEQSAGMASALKAAGKPYKLVELKGEDHWLSKTETRQQMLTELEAFLREHLGPGVN
ncbi:S9 family peptidase [Aquidulcibacter sp.]|uniref:alpha/beta hydrolase family protein n=1 Tax=Aquidulcibacter sp. TaxID=2052990 RepID=UPI0025BF308D|nr:S9 family peptidase [Aquidulcibacter sp.]MCA3693729.1 S9 family peptidase [Aquidulcibacter sp.]